MRKVLGLEDAEGEAAADKAAEALEKLTVEKEGEGEKEADAPAS